MVHGNIKSSNILLDNDENACLADYYFAGLTEIPDAAKTSSRYMAPELFDSEKMCKESDVYSFGVVLFELVTGKDPSLVSTDLPTWIHSIEEERWRIEVLDARLKSDGELSQSILGMLRIAMVCTVFFVSTRPTMGNVVNMLLNLENPLSKHIGKIGTTL